ncbi:MAG: pyruvate dehydrogenase [Chloroflexi bacterium]|nr:pyruvate dehydrogenase [Chloroflexota bacterium]
MQRSTSPTTDLHPAFDWPRLAYLALVSRAMDEMEERELTPKGLVKYQFSASGHELGQLLLSQLTTHPHDGASVYYRCRPYVLGSGLTPVESFMAGMTRAGSMSEGRDVGVVWNMPRRNGATILPNAADVGSQYTPGVGWAQAIRYRVEELGHEDWDGAIAIIFGGDGSVASNGFWSALTIATTLKLPALFVIEDNGLAISVRGHLQTPGGNIAKNLASFQNLKVWDGSGVRPAETAPLVYEAVNYVRSGAGPGLLHITVPRISGHSSVDNQAYKSAEERAQDAQRDPLPAIRDYLVPALMSAEEWEALVARAQADVEAARDEALRQPEPEVSSVTQFVWHDPANPAQVGGLAPEGVELPRGSDIPNPPDPSRINMVEAIRRTLDVEMALNPRVLVFGEDVGLKGGVHAATVGLQSKYGERRVFDTSLSEEGIIGRAVGMALAGLMPAPEIQFRKYADPATEQLHNCGTTRWRSANHFASPIVVRIPGGYRKIGDPWHSVTDEVFFAHAVGWKVAVPSNAEDAVGLLRTALRGNDPVIFFEHRAMYDAAWARRPYPGDDFMLPFGKARITREGDELTVVTWGAMVERCEEAALRIAASIEIIDLRTLQPWDKEAVLASVRKTSKCLIVHEDIEFGGFGAEIAAVIADEAFTDLDGPVLRVGSPQVMVPFSQTLMTGVVPSVERIQDAMERLLAF